MQDTFEQRLLERELRENPIETIPNPTAARPHGDIPNTPLAVSTISFLLGSIFTLGLFIFLSGGLNNAWFTTYQLGFFIVSWSAFHWGEFAVTAGWNRERVSVDSFLLNNGRMYHIANGLALAEYLVVIYFRPSLKSFPYVSSIGKSLCFGGHRVLCTPVWLVLLGQFLRSAAMIKAGSNFSHAVAFRRQVDHRLVTDGVYAWFRHPSYAGFFYWALGTQLVLQNPLSFSVYSVLLMRFFSSRIRAEERALISFFGDDYVSYRGRVGTRIPFIP
ncbi:Isoprenylcysteine carboxyl methyltransferase family-domain-containing protein [Russula earlei]|uniref:Isoprenylcysteine carboxyl methyltransferase family-domain-containing protein n=1 Tax=Russula earlei TaxID=71964 RepID=A0ACC0UKZ1_9AGAM|nr:Isoprenylcysteine carboxyl methyltransferase family-domain-containing protein [Russula earlei]